MFKADIQIDDRVQNMDPEIPTKILFPSYHNRDITDEELKEKGIDRAGYEWRTGWEELERMLMAQLVIDEPGLSYTKKDN
jgi:5'(3')-deoxyribonucleotidase